jgi:hypothetical protein
MEFVPYCVQLWALVPVVLSLLVLTLFSHTRLTLGAEFAESLLCCRVCGPVRDESLRSPKIRHQNLQHTQNNGSSINRGTINYRLLQCYIINSGSIQHEI